MTPSFHPKPGARRFAFHDFVLDVESGFLTRAGEEVPLQPKAFEVLRYLVERHGRLVTKDELIEAAWPQTATTDNSLAQCLVQIRRALADESQSIVRTVARRGYMFAAPVRSPALEMPRPVEAAVTIVPPALRPWWSRHAGKILAAVVLVSVATGVLLYPRARRQGKPELVYTQITNFPDYASGPALSRDGRMVAFFRGPGLFATGAPVYVKMLPRGEPVLVTDDRRNKYGLAFSPDGAQIAYTAWENAPGAQWLTYTVPLPGGEPRLMFANAAGLTWLDEQQLLYSEIRTGLHMGIVTSAVNRTNRREIYFPSYERRMAHYSYRSPDQKWLLTAEMEPRWLPCRLLPFDGSSPGRNVGPNGPCTATGWSPDGKWMYFGAEVNGEKHLWRQEFPDGKPEQLTFGPAEEEGLAVAPDGSLVTSVGVRQSAVWIHDAQGERVISPEGFAAANYLVFTAPVFSADGRHVYHLLRRETAGSPNELWRTDIVSKASERIILDFNVIEFDVSGDEGGSGEAVFSAQPEGKPSEIWLARLDRSAPPKRIASGGEGSPRFGPDGSLWYRYSDGKANYVGLMNRDGSGRRQVAPYPVSTVMGSSPGGRWLIAMAPAPGRSAIDTIAIPAGGGQPRVIGNGRLPVLWDRAGKFCYLGVGGQTILAFPVRPGELPDEPAGGFDALRRNPPLGVRVVRGAEISPGPDPSTYAFVKSNNQRNLFRISLR